MSRRSNAQRKTSSFTEERLEEREEFERLVAEVKPLGFTQSSQLSKYIVKNKLGYKYKNISGILEMQLGNDTWDFKGGFPPKIYAKLCKALKFDEHGSEAKPIKFTPFKSVQ